MTDAPLAHGGLLQQIAQGQDLVLAKLDEIIELVSPPPVEEGNSLHDLLAQLVAAMERQGTSLDTLSIQISRLEQQLLLGRETVA